MELMFIALLGAIMGLAARYVLPHRHTHGVVLMPAVGVIAAAVIWEVFTWLGFKWDAGLIWWIAVLGTAFVLAVVGILTGRLRTRSDDRLFDRLSKGAPVSAN